MARITACLALLMAALLLSYGCSAGSSPGERTLADLKDVPAEGDANAHKPLLDVGNSKGNLAPDFSVTTTDGKTVTLSELTREGKPVLLYFWASWCPYCKRDLAVANAVYPQYADKVRLVAIDLDLNEGMPVVANYKTTEKHDGMDFAPGYEKVLQDYGVVYTTTKYAIDRNGIILWKGSGEVGEKTWEILLKGLAEAQ